MATVDKKEKKKKKTLPFSLKSICKKAQSVATVISMSFKHETMFN